MSHPAGNLGAEGTEQPGADGKRLWMTAEEFLAHVEAHRAARLTEIQNSKKVSAPTTVARVYQLNPFLIYRPKPKTVKLPEVVR